MKSAAATAAEETARRPAPDLALRWRRRRAAVDERIEAQNLNGGGKAVAEGSREKPVEKNTEEERRKKEEEEAGRTVGRRKKTKQKIKEETGQRAQ